MLRPTVVASHWCLFKPRFPLCKQRVVLYRLLSRLVVLLRPPPLYVFRSCRTYRYCCCYYSCFDDRSVCLTALLSLTATTAAAKAVMASGSAWSSSFGGRQTKDSRWSQRMALEKQREEIQPGTSWKRCRVSGWLSKVARCVLLLEMAAVKMDSVLGSNSVCVRRSNC